MQLQREEEERAQLNIAGKEANTQRDSSQQHKPPSFSAHGESIGSGVQVEDDVTISLLSHSEDPSPSYHGDDRNPIGFGRAVVVSCDACCVYSTAVATTILPVSRRSRISFVTIYVGSFSNEIETTTANTCGLPLAAVDSRCPHHSVNDGHLQAGIHRWVYDNAIFSGPCA